MPTGVQMAWSFPLRSRVSPSCCSTTPFQLAFVFFYACTVNFFASVVFAVRKIFPAEETRSEQHSMKSELSCFFFFFGGGGGCNYDLEESVGQD